jgi:hypothetical protein
MIENFEEWKKNLLVASIRDEDDEQSFHDFTDLVEILDGTEGIEALRVLMKTFSDKPDYGTQESVNTIFLNFPQQLYVQAVLEELPRLEIEANEWVDCLMADLVRIDRDQLIKTLNSMDKPYRDLFKKWVNTPEFLEDFPQTIDILKQLKD